MTAAISTTKLIAMLQDARSRTYELVDDLDQQQLIGRKLSTVNPLQWEIGHVAYFYEYFILRQLYGQKSLLGNARADALYDSISETASSLACFKRRIRPLNIHKHVQIFESLQIPS